MNREIVGGGGASIYPLTGDIQSVAGSPTVSVTGLEGIPLAFSGLDDGDFLVYDETVNNWVNRSVVISSIELQTNGTDNSSQTLLNLAEGTNITLTESGGTVTINAPTPTGASTIIQSWGPQGAVTGNSTFQTMITYTIPANTIPPGKGIEFDFSAIGLSGTFTTNSWQIVFDGNVLGWNGLVGASEQAFGGARIVNLPGVTNSQTFVITPLQVDTASAVSQIVSAVNTSTTSDTTTPLVLELQWNGPNTMSTEVFQAFVKFI